MKKKEIEWKSNKDIQMDIPEVFQRKSKPKRKCDCETYSCGESKQMFKKKMTLVRALSGLVITVIFFWHILFFEVLVKKKLQKDIAKHPDIFVRKFIKNFMGEIYDAN